MTTEVVELSDIDVELLDIDVDLDDEICVVDIIGSACGFGDSVVNIGPVTCICCAVNGRALVSNGKVSFVVFFESNVVDIVGVEVVGTNLVVEK